MKKVVSIVFAVCILFSLAGCSRGSKYNPETDPANPENVIPTTGDETNTATIWEVPTPEPRLVKGELMYSLPYGNEVASTRNKSEWESWRQLRRAIVDKTLVCAGYAQLFYLIVRERYPDVKYIQSNQLNHARNYFEDEHWDLTWLDDAGVDYNPDKIKFDFVGMQKRISAGLYCNGNGVGSDWKVANIIIGEHP